MTTIIVTGGKGQLGLCLKDEACQLGLNSRINLFFPDIEELDLTCPEDAIREKILGMAPMSREEDRLIVINCAAYTAVDPAENEKEKAAELNVEVPRKLSNIISSIPGSGLIQLSTDYVFDGATNRPYTEQDGPNPLSVYGKTKFEAEKAIRKLSFMGKGIVIRTAWLYSEYGKNFVKTMIRLASEKKEIGVVIDQIGTPTYAPYLAKTLIRIALDFEKECRFKAALLNCTDSGVASWYDLAAFAIGLLEEEHKASVKPILTSEYPTAATRPAFSLLSKEKLFEIYGIRHPHWTDGVIDCIQKLQRK